MNLNTRTAVASFIVGPALGLIAAAIVGVAFTTGRVASGYAIIAVAQLLVSQLGGGALAAAAVLVLQRSRGLPRRFVSRSLAAFGPGVAGFFIADAVVYFRQDEWPIFGMTLPIAVVFAVVVASVTRGSSDAVLAVRRPAVPLVTSLLVAAVATVVPFAVVPTAVTGRSASTIFDIPTPSALLTAAAVVILGAIVLGLWSATLPDRLSRLGGVLMMAGLTLSHTAWATRVVIAAFRESQSAYRIVLNAELTGFIVALLGVLVAITGIICCTVALRRDGEAAE